MLPFGDSIKIAKGNKIKLRDCKSRREKVYLFLSYNEKKLVYEVKYFLFILSYTGNGLMPTKKTN